MNKKIRQPLMRQHLPLLLLGAIITLYGLLTALVGGWFSSQAMNGVITAGEYRNQLAAFDQTGGLIAGILFLVLFISCAVFSKGIVRVAFAIGAVASISPILSPRAENLLFNVLKLPTMSAGSVVAGAVTTLFFMLPLLICFILLACGGRVPKACRWVSLAAIFVVLGTALYPIYVTVMAFLIKPGDPAVGRMIEVSSLVIKLRYILLGLCFLWIGFLSIQFARTSLGAQPAPSVLKPDEARAAPGGNG